MLYRLLQQGKYELVASQTIHILCWHGIFLLKNKHKIDFRVQPTDVYCMYVMNAEQILIWKFVQISSNTQIIQLRTITKPIMFLIPCPQIGRPCPKLLQGRPGPPANRLWQDLRGGPVFMHCPLLKVLHLNGNSLACQK